MLRTWLKKHWLPLLLLAAFLYLAIGATAPFFHYKTISDETKGQFSAEQFCQDSPGVDRAMILETNESAWEERLRFMNLAKERIILSTFDFRDGESPRDLLSVMLHKAEQGVQVKILVDGFSGLVRMEGNEIFYALSSHPNVEIKLYNPLNLALPWKTQGRMHDKYVIVDDYGYILGGRNTFDYFIGSYPTDSRSHDREVLVYNTAHGTERSSESSLGQVERYFDGVWNLDVCRLFHDDPKLAGKKAVMEAVDTLHARYEGLALAQPELLDESMGGLDREASGGETSGEGIPGGEVSGEGIPGAAETQEAAQRRSRALSYYETNTREAGKITLVSNPTDIYGKEPVVFFTLTELMKHAKESVTVHTPYAVFNSYMYDTMRDVNARVPVDMMINSVENGDNFFASSDYLRHKKEMARTGITIYEYDGGMSYHGKSLVIDHQLAAVGSYNFDLRSTYMDTELMLVIQSEELAADLEGYMDSYQKDCRMLLPDGTYQTPEHITVAQVPLWKRAAWAVVGFVMQPVRFLI